MAVTAMKAKTRTENRTRSHRGARSEHIVAVRLAETAYGIPVALVHEIIQPCEAAAIPDSPEDVRGILDLHGTMAPVLDLRRRVGLPPASDRDEPAGARIVIVETEEGLVGLLVDGVAQVCRVPLSPLASSSRRSANASSGMDAELALGVGRVGRSPITVLNIPNVARMDRAVADYVAEYAQQARTRSAA